MTRIVVVTLALVAGATSVHAQTAAAPASIEVMPRAAFHMSAELLGGADDIRLKWDADFGGEMDVIDYRVGRFTFAANYEVIMGEELRRFDPNQGNYILEGALSARLPGVELAGVFYHQSRHLSDRPKVQPIDWNMLGVRARRGFTLGALQMDARADLRSVVQSSFVDYRWEFDGRLRADRVVYPGIGLLVAGGVRHLGTDQTRQRDGVTGFRAEAGVRVEGGGGAMELFVGAERRIDPHPVEFGTATWAMAGFRLLSR